MGTGICQFFHLENGISCTGRLGFINKKTIENENIGLRFEQGRHCDEGICAVGRWDLVKIWAVKWEYI